MSNTIFGTDVDVSIIPTNYGDVFSWEMIQQQWQQPTANAAKSQNYQSRCLLHVLISFIYNDYLQKGDCSTTNTCDLA
jgi:hypothetical protein